MAIHYTTLRTREQKAELRRKLGDKCVKCGFDDWRALQFDHINGKGGGRKRPTGYKYYLLLVKEYEEGKLQLLCANCNWIKRYEGDRSEMGGKNAAQLDEIKARFDDRVQRLRTAGFSLPPRIFGDKSTMNTITPNLCRMLKILDEPVKAYELSVLFTEFGWQFAGKSTDQGAMLIRTAVKRRPDAFVMSEGYVFIQDLAEVRSYRCNLCQYSWVPRVPGAPGFCAKCRKSWNGTGRAVTEELFDALPCRSAGERIRVRKSRKKT